MKANAFDKEKVFVGKVSMQIDQLESEKTGKTVYLMPANSTLIEPPTDLSPGQIAKWVGTQWIKETLKTPVEPAPVEPAPVEPDQIEMSPEQLKRDELSTQARIRLESAPRPQSIDEIADMIDDVLLLSGISVSWTKSGSV